MDRHTACAYYEEHVSTLFDDLRRGITERIPPHGREKLGFGSTGEHGRGRVGRPARGAGLFARQGRHSAGEDLRRIGGHSGEILEPKRCLLKVAIISRPFGDPAINEVVWKAADEQIIPPKERRAWEANGLRLGRIIGELPLELEAIMNDTTSHQKVSPTDFFVESGEPTLIKISDPVEQATVLLNRDNRASSAPTTGT